MTGTYERTSTLLFQKPLAWGVGAEILATDERNRIVDGVARPRQTYFVGSVFGRATIDTSDSLLDPTRGFRVTGFLAPETSRTQGEQDIPTQPRRWAGYQSVGERTVLVARLALPDQGADLIGIAPSRRLCRRRRLCAYGEQVGPKNEFVEPIGGWSLVGASFEAHRYGLFRRGGVGRALL